MERPRPSSIPPLEDGSPNPEWLITEDGHSFQVGDRLYNYYDGKWGTVVNEPGHHGWFDFKQDDGSVTILNSVRVSKNPPTGGRQ
jgi:hypothetical protein